MDKNMSLNPDQRNETPLTGLSLGRFFLAMGLRLGIFLALVVVKFASPPF